MLSIVAVILLLAAGAVLAGPLNPFAGEHGFVNVQMEPHGVRTFTMTCKANERTAVMAIGRGTTPLGVYVYDVHGNCVALDDLSNSAQNYSDDIAVAWQPPREQTYDIQLRNGGRVTNRVELAIR
jgi:hypothetical protein